VEDAHDHAHDPTDDAGEAEAGPSGVLKGEEGGVLGVLLEEEEEARHGEDAAAWGRVGRREGRKGCEGRVK